MHHLLICPFSLLDEFYEGRGWNVTCGIFDLKILIVFSLYYLYTCLPVCKYEQSGLDDDNLSPNNK
jgi:hypothetical protein